jgi:hypothetical protein
MVDARTNQMMVQSMREPELVKEAVLRYDAYARNRIRFRAPTAAYELLGVTNHPLIQHGPGDEKWSDPDTGTFFSYAPVASLLAYAGFKVEVVAMTTMQLQGPEGEERQVEVDPFGFMVLGTVKVAPTCTVVVDPTGAWIGLEGFLE